MGFSLRSFFRRRIQIDVKPSDLVLDVGSGDKPHWRADVLLDYFVSATYANQRSGGGQAVVDRWLVEGNVEAMPFKDKVFDYVICSHVLEHVRRPDRAMTELQRVAKRGYIEVPFEGAQKLSDFPTHLWYVHPEGERLVFTAKQGQVFDDYINQVMKIMVRAGVWGSFQDRFFDDCIVTYYWKGAIPYDIRGNLSVGPPHDKFRQAVMLSSTLAMEARSLVRYSRLGVIRTRLFGLLRLIYRATTRPPKLDIATLLQCCQCKADQFRAGPDGYQCRACGAMIPILS